MIVGVFGYDSLRKHLAACGYYTAEIREKYYLRIADVYIENQRKCPMRIGGVNNMKNYKITVAGTGARDIIGSTKKNYDN